MIHVNPGIDRSYDTESPERVVYYGNVFLLLTPSHTSD
jgi:hypothetical protein